MNTVGFCSNSASVCGVSIFCRSNWNKKPPRPPEQKVSQRLAHLRYRSLPALLPKLVEAIAAWVGKRPERTVSLRLVSGGHQVELTFAPQSMSPEKISEYIRSIEAASGLEHT